MIPFKCNLAEINKKEISGTPGVLVAKFPELSGHELPVASEVDSDVLKGSPTIMDDFTTDPCPRLDMSLMSRLGKESRGVVWIQGVSYDLARATWVAAWWHCEGANQWVNPLMRSHL